MLANSPIIANDPTGERIIIVGDSEYRGAVLFQLILSARSKAGFKRLVNAIESKDNLVIQMGDGVNGISDRRKNDDGTSTQFLNFNPFNSEQQDDVNSVPSETLVHEIDHFLNKDPKKHLPFYNGRYIEDSNTGTSYPDSFPRSEFPAVRAQNEHRATFGKKVRRNYDGVDIFNKEPSDKRGDKLVPSSKPFNKNDYFGKTVSYGTIFNYLFGTKRQTTPPSHQNVNKQTPKGGEIRKMRALTISKEK